MVGGTVSAKVIICTQPLVLPHASVASQCRAMPARPVQLTGSATSTWLTITACPQLSPVVGLPVLAGSVESPQASTLSIGQLMVGGTVSAKVIICTQPRSEERRVGAG